MYSKIYRTNTRISLVEIFLNMNIYVEKYFNILENFGKPFVFPIWVSWETHLQTPATKTLQFQLSLLLQNIWFEDGIEMTRTIINFNIF